jgi:ParB family chromosome partitioning protein
VEIKSSGKGNKGKIVLDFKNQEELDNILSHFRL